MNLIIFISLFIMDYFFKDLSKKNWQFKEINFLNKRLNFCYVKNYGIAFNLFQKKRKLIIILNIIYLIYLIYVFVDNINYRIDILLVIIGGMGNLFDRIKRGYVIDYIYIKKLPVFNLSDIYILTGVIKLIIK